MKDFSISFCQIFLFLSIFQRTISHRAYELTECSQRRIKNNFSHCEGLTQGHNELQQNGRLRSYKMSALVGGVGCRSAHITCTVSPRHVW